MIYFLKHLIKKYFWRQVYKQKIFEPAATLNREFVDQLTSNKMLNTPTLNIFTTNNEDGILLEIFHKIKTTRRFFIDIGSHDGINSNCANLAFHHNWSGAFIDGSALVINRGKYIYRKFFKEQFNRFRFKKAVIKIENVPAILAALSPENEVDLLCIDLDGNDYHIWSAIDSISPRVVLVEVQVEKGNIPYIPPYNKSFETYETNTPKGASPLSMTELAGEKGYELVAANKGCFNLFFVRKDCMQGLVPLSIEKALRNN